MVPRYQSTSFMLRGNCFVVNLLSYNITITWVVRKQNNGRKSGRSVTGNICEIYYSFQDVLSESEIKSSHNIAGKNPLLICRDCFNSNIKIPNSGGSSNGRENQGQRGAENTQSTM